QPVQEERALLHVVERGPRIELDLGHIRLDLREVRPHGAVEREIGRDAPAERGADPRRTAAVRPARGLWPTAHRARGLWRDVEYQRSEEHTSELQSPDH